MFWQFYDCLCVVSYYSLTSISAITSPTLSTPSFRSFQDGVGAARLSRRADLVELLRNYDSVDHPADVCDRDFMFSLLALLHLLPSANTKHKARVSTSELATTFI